MPKVRFIEHDGVEHVVDAPTGDSLMKIAVSNAIESISASCGGALACATCHCYIDEAWRDRVTPKGIVEDEMLEGVTAERRPESRLSCQIVVTEELDGLVVRLPDRQ
jgi:ferredoxin, 2Fe-2S